MKYVQRELGDSAENSSGGGRSGMWREIGLLSGLVTLSLTILYFLIAAATDWAVSLISPEREAAFFKEFAAAGFVDQAPEDLAEKWEQAQQILDKLVQYEEVVPLQYSLVYSPEPSANAFAVPGGTIVLTDGLLRRLDEEIAIAFVIAHELGHFAGRDHLRRLGRQFGFGVSVSILTGGRSDGVVKTATDFVALNYNREQESAADTFAIGCLDAVYGNREGAERLFEILEEESGLPEWAYMFMTHPANADRIRRVKDAEAQR